VRIKNILTSIRLENMVWDILAEMAEEESCTTNALIAKFHEEILEHRGEVPNFASFLRVTSMRYLHRSMLRLEKQLNPPPQLAVTPIAARSGETLAAPKALVAVGR
jgi:predicted DNA-binding ribbon-helix-helix protein